MGAPKQKWTADEESALKAGVVKHGAGKWRTILKDSEFSSILYLRSNVDLKDKWRNMTVMANGWGSREKARVALRRMQISKPEENPQEDSDIQSDEETVDVRPTPGPRKAIFRLDNLIMEAINSLKDPSGSNKTAISAYIEAKYWCPPDLKRLLSMKLKQLTSNGKLIKVKRKYRISGASTSVDRGRSTDALARSVLERRPLPPLQPSSLEGRQWADSDSDDDQIFLRAQAEIDLAEMLKMTPAEAEKAAAEAVFDACRLVAQAEEAEREALEAEEKAAAAVAHLEATKKAIRERNAQKM
ncbi:hypothetical protein UlMin_031137, partial [Ulmus minor]